MIGMFVFGEIYTWIAPFHTSGAMGPVLLSDWLNISIGLIGFLVIVMALLMFWGGEWLENKFSSREVTS
jgi:hypothetical protein